MTADRLGDGVLTEAGEVDFLAGGFELIHQLEHEAARIGGFHEWGQGIQQKCSLAKFSQAHSKTSEQWQLFA